MYKVESGAVTPAITTRDNGSVLVDKRATRGQIGGRMKLIAQIIKALWTICVNLIRKILGMKQGAGLLFDCKHADQNQFNEAIEEIKTIVPLGFSRRPDIEFINSPKPAVILTLHVYYKNMEEANHINQGCLKILERRGLY
jgi:hypothetical protein